MSLEGLVILAIVYFVLSLIAKAGKKFAAQIETARDQLTDVEPSETQGEEFSLAKVLREIERTKAEAEQGRLPTKPKPESEAQRLGRMQRALVASRRLGTPGDQARGPLGRPRRVSLQYEGESLDGRSLEVEERIVSFDDVAPTRTARIEIDQDDQAQAIVQRRLDAAAHRTREGREASYQAQQKAAAAAVASEALSAAATSSRLRRAIVWREILGPPVAFRGEDE